MLLPLNAATRTLNIHTARQARRCLATAACDETDIVIVGGGPAGLALATALGSSKVVSQNLKVALVEAGDLSKVKEWTPATGSFSNRVSSITNASRSFLQEIGAWSQVESGRTCPIEEMQVWDGLSDARITFGSPPSTSEMPRLTENLNLQRALLRRLSSLPSVELLDKVKVQTIARDEREGGGWPLVHLSDGRVLRARLLVGADGPNSPVRAFSGTASYGWAYDTHAVVATLVHAPRSALEAANTVAYQRFLPTGPVAFLPLSPTTSSLVWSTQPHLARALVGAQPEVLAAMVNAAFRLPEVSLRYLHERVLESPQMGAEALREEMGWRERAHGIDSRSAFSSLATAGAGGVPLPDADMLPPLITGVQVGTVASFPLRYNHADKYIGEGTGARTVLVGDAAHTIHPLAGQGLNLGLGDVNSLTNCIEEALLRGGDIGSYTALLPYARERYFENHKVMAAVDKLHKLYSRKEAPVVWARSVGVEVLNELDTIKAAIMMSAGGTLSSRSASGWSVAAGGVESLARTVDTGKRVAEGVVGLAGAGFQELLKRLSSSSSSSSR